MSYVVHTGNRAYVTSPPRIPAPVMHDDSLEENEWALYEDDEPITRPRQITEETPGEIRAKLHELDPAKFPLKVTFKPAPDPVPAARPSPTPKERRPVSTSPAPQLPIPELSPSVMIADSETGEVITVDSDMRGEAMRVHDAILYQSRKSLDGMRDTGAALREMRNRRLYLALGFTNFDRYCKDKLGLSRDQADRSIQVTEFIEANDATLRQIPMVSQSALQIMSRIPVDQQGEFLATLPDDTTPTVKETERLVKQWQERFEATEHRLHQIEADRDAANRNMVDATRKANQLAAKVQELENRPAPPTPPPEKVEVTIDNPELLARITSLEKDRAQIAKERDELLAHTGGVQQVKATIKQLKKEEDQLKERIRRSDHAWDNTGFDLKGGHKLTDAVGPLLSPIANALAVARVLKITGAGGSCDTDTVYRLVPDLRELADLLTTILEKRTVRPIFVDGKEVEEDASAS